MKARNQLSEEIRRIPRPAFVIAGIMLLLCATIGFLLISRATANAEIMTVLLSIVIGGFLAVYVLAIGYVNVDAGRRGMSRLLWTLLVIFVPNALGFILYFLLRQPIRAQCLQCGAAVDADVHYCPACGQPLAPGCPNCRHAIGLNDAFCSHCGHGLRGTPASGS